MRASPTPVRMRCKTALLDRWPMRPMAVVAQSWSRREPPRTAYPRLRPHAICRRSAACQRRRLRYDLCAPAPTRHGCAWTLAAHRRSISSLVACAARAQLAAAAAAAACGSCRRQSGPTRVGLCDLIEVRRTHVHPLHFPRRERGSRVARVEGVPINACECSPGGGKRGRHAGAISCFRF